jgi:flagellar biosynthesis protein FlhF
MISRTFRAESMMQALDQIKKELGVDALVVSARQVPGGQPWQVWHKPLFEVVAVQLESGEESSDAVETGGKEKPATPGNPLIKDLNRKDTVLPKKITPASVSHQRLQPTSEGKVQVPTAQSSSVSSEGKPADTHTAAPASKPVDVVEIGEWKAKAQPEVDSKLGLIQQLGQDESLEDIRIIQASASNKKQALPPLQLPQLPWQPPKEDNSIIDGAWPVLQQLYKQLIRQGLESGLAKRVCQLSADTLGYETALDNRKVVEHLRRQLEAYIKVNREFTGKTRQVICVVGPSGAGKTNFSAKLAVRYRNELKRSVAWVCADTVRTGGIAEARAFTEAINIPMKIAYTPQECSAIVESFAGTDLVIVDTPACNPRSEESLVETGSLLTAIPDRSTWIVVPATAKENDLVNATGAFSVFKPRALVFTKMDETNTFGSVYNLGVRSQLPFSYFSCGSRIISDLVPAAPSRLVQSLFTERFDR